MSIKSNSISINTDDIQSVDDVIDLNQPFFNNEDGRITSMSYNNRPLPYRISLHSIDDDELKRFHRDLVTPAPSVCYDDDHLQHHMFRTRYPTTSSSYPRPTSRSESVMLFKKINNGDEDVTSFDLVSSELRDFLDTDFMLDDILSRPVSRTTISKNASKINDINKFRNTFHKPAGDHFSKSTTSMRSPPSLLKRKTQENYNHLISTTSPSSNRNNGNNNNNPRLAALNKGDSMPLDKFRTTNKVIHEKHHQQEHRRPDKIEQQHNKHNNITTKDEYLYKQIPRRLITTTNNNHHLLLTQREKLIKRQKEHHLLQQTISNSIDNNPVIVNTTAPRSFYRNESVNSSITPGEQPDNHRHRNTHRSYGRGEVVGELVEYTPRRPRQSTFNSNNSSTKNVRRFERNRSDTTSSSSSDELLSTPSSEEYHQTKSTMKNNNNNNDTGGGRMNPFLAQNNNDTTHDFQQPRSAVANSASATNNSGHYSSSLLQHHRYSVPNTKSATIINNRHDENVTKSYSSSHSKLHAASNASTKGEDYSSSISVTDSAKQVLACIRERRKSAMVMEQSPKMESRTRFISSSLTTQQQRQQEDNDDSLLASDFRTRLQIRRGEISNVKMNRNHYQNSAIRRYASGDVMQQYHLYGNNEHDNSRLLITSRLPQRTALYR